MLCLKQMKSHLEVVSACLLYYSVAVLYTEVHNLVGLFIFVAIELLSPYLRKRDCNFGRYQGFSVTTLLQATKCSTFYGEIRFSSFSATFINIYYIFWFI
jgi:hypothetical protein